jgi:hypothetical protein
MILSRRVAVGGVQLDEISPWIVIRSVDHGVPKETISAVSQMGGSGQRITSAHWETMDVSVSYAIDLPKKRLEERRQIFEAVNTWASRGGWLTFSWMPNRRFWVDRVEIPSTGDLWNWTESMTLTFKAYNVPFWQDVTAAASSAKLVTDGSVVLDVPGNVQTVLDAEFVNKSGQTINKLTLTVGSQKIAFTNLGLGGSESMVISHGTDGLLRITAGGRSVLSRRTGSDDLFVNPGTNTVIIKAERAGDLSVSAFGRYL